MSTSAASTPPGSPAGRTCLRRPRCGRGPRARLDRAEADRRPHQQPARLHRGVGAEAVVAHRLDERPRHLDVRLAPEREDEPAVLRGNELRRASAAPNAPRSCPTARRRRAAARGRRRSDRRSRRPARPCCRSGCRAGPGDTPSRVATLRMLTASSPDSWKISTAAVTISSASRSKSALLLRDGRSRHHHQLADDAAVGQALERGRELVERGVGGDRVAQAAVGDERRQGSRGCRRARRATSRPRTRRRARCSRRRGRARRSSATVPLAKPTSEQPPVARQRARPRPRPSSPPTGS